MSQTKQGSMPWLATDPPQNWATPRALFQDLERRFAGPDGFMLDAAAEATNAKAPYYFDEELDALNRDWTITPEARRMFEFSPARDIAVYCNPPYEEIEPWVRKALAEVQRGSCRLVCMLVPARVDQIWWQDVVKPFAWHIEFVDGRVHFDPPPGVKARAPFEASAVVVFAQRICARR